MDTWRARATFVVDGTGTIDVTRQAPIKRTYRGIDAMGLFTYGKALSESTTQNLPAPNIRNQITTTIGIQRDGIVIAAATCQRRFMPPGVGTRDVREDGLVGEFFEPAGTGRRPGLVVLGGSEGGIDRYGAAGLARVATPCWRWHTSACRLFPQNW